MSPLKNSTSPDAPPAADTAVVSSAPDQGRSRLSKSVSDLREKRSRVGVQPGTKRGQYHKGPAPAAGSAAAPSAPAAPLFTPSDTALLVELPFNLAFVKTGYEGFLLTPMEKETLGRTGTVVLNQWVGIDPKYVALIVFSLALLKTTAEKTLMYRAALRERDERKIPETHPEKGSENGSAS